MCTRWMLYCWHVLARVATEYISAFIAEPVVGAAGGARPVVRGFHRRTDLTPLSKSQEAFKKTKLTVKDIDNAVKSVRRKAYEKKK